MGFKLQEPKNPRTKKQVTHGFWFFGSSVLWFFGSMAAAEPGSYSDRLISLAAKCDEQGLKEQAAITRAWIIPRHSGRQYLFLPATTDPAIPKSGAPPVARQWYDAFRALRREQAASLFAVAKAACNGQQPARAYQLLYEVLREDPDHAEARRILGFSKNARGQWVLPETEKMVAEQQRINHPKLNWKARGYWRLATPHFEIVTNHSPAEALEAGQQLENLHTLWRQLFFRYWSTQEALAARFAGRDEPLARPRPKMQVVLFKNRQEYVTQLAPSQPQIAATVGIYQHKDRIAYFFAGDTSVYPTWYHEATHQLFQESVPGTSDDPGEEHDFWAIEGAALYMESLVDHSGYWTAGGCEADRLQFARYRGLSGEFLLPLQRLTALGREAIQKSADIRQLYAQAAGVVHFLIDGQEGKYREPFVDLLTGVYQPNATPDLLAKTTAQPLAALDQQYLTFLNVSDDDLAGIPEPERIRNLSLGRTRITDQGLARLAGCKNLDWLDLSLTAATDAGLAKLAAATKLKQLFLEGTKITDASLPLIGGCKSLETLDLANLRITDAGLAAIANLRELKTLYLTGSPITDAGLAHLRGFKKLETLDTRGTQITPAGRQRLKTDLPKLKDA
jgi:Leucine Rich repeat